MEMIGLEFSNTYVKVRLDVIRENYRAIRQKAGVPVLAVVVIWLLVDVILISENIAKIPVAVLTVVINYIASKLLIFRKNGKK